MDEVDFMDVRHKVPLKDILEVYGQPISEEQAWALCYQSCTKLINLLCWSHWVPTLEGVENIYICEDGTVSFASCAGSPDSNQSVKEILKCLGQILFAALDWGLTDDLERDLAEPLGDLLCCMLGYQTEIKYPLTNFQYSFTLNDIRKVCEERLFLQSQASIYYQTVCRIYYAEHMEFQKLLSTIEHSKQSLEQSDMEEILEKRFLPRYYSWGDLWCCVVKELRHGIRLRNSKERSYVGLTVTRMLSPHERLMRDIRSRRYTLRKVKDIKKHKMDTSDDNFITAFIRERPLRPASERTLRDRTPEEPSLHEMLMNEIRSATKLRPTSSPKNEDCEQGLSPPPDADFRMSEQLYGSDSGLGVRAKRQRRGSNSCDLLDGSEVKISWQSDSNSDSSSDSKLSDIADLTFFPVLTSSQVDLKINSFVNQKAKSFLHKRSSSYDGSSQKTGSLQRSKSCYYQRILPQTIEELVLARQAAMKADFMERNGCSGYRVCSTCNKKRFFFSWPYTCKMCERVSCHECSIEMSMPFKQCMHIPISFFKPLVLNQLVDAACKDYKSTIFYRATLNWDSSTIPLVFEPKYLSEEVPSHKNSMINWTCMDICTKCEEYILDVLDQSQRIELPISGLKARSTSVS
ncbi:protein spire homolog 1-like [Pelobates fuscus]|uniref:protein spire homolog 1-like n=1 Tax=Pelobates fuscus TaxID=191477 RepID=UPI002FE47FC3